MSPFLVGAELVEFDRRDLPIYLTPQTLWAEAGCETISYGAPLDRLFGEPGEVFVSGVAGSETIPSLAPLAGDALVALADLADGLLVPPSAQEQSVAALDDHIAVPAPLPEMAIVYDFTSDPWSDWMVDHPG